MQHLPVHPTARHPRTGAPLRALYVRPDGRVFWPIIGASPDEQTPTTPPPSTPPPATPPPAQPPANPQAPPNPPAPPANPQTTSTPPPAADDGKDLGFPKDTPVAQMKTEEQAAYWRHQARKHESRATEWQTLVGDKTPEQVKADLEAGEKARRDQMTDAQRAVEDAKQQTQQATARTVGEQNARVALEFALGHDPEKNDRSALLDTIDMRRLTTDDGKVDADKVRALAAQLAPTGKDTGTRRPDFGAGHRGGGSGKTGVAAGRALYDEESRPKKTTSTT